jgi:hypothetical protein
VARRFLLAASAWHLKRTGSPFPSSASRSAAVRELFHGDRPLGSRE